MQTTSETILLITAWSLTVCGLFFGTKTKLRKRNEKKSHREHESRTQS